MIIHPHNIYVRQVRANISILEWGEDLLPCWDSLALHWPSYTRRGPGLTKFKLLTQRPQKERAWIKGRRITLEDFCYEKSATSHPLPKTQLWCLCLKDPLSAFRNKEKEAPATEFYSCCLLWSAPSRTAPKNTTIARWKCRCWCQTAGLENFEETLKTAKFLLGIL